MVTSVVQLLSGFSARAAEPEPVLVELCERCTIDAMKGAPSPKSRRRSRQPLGRKTFVYLTEEERKVIDRAAAAERRSVSSFIANAAVDAAARVIDGTRNRK